MTDEITMQPEATIAEHDMMPSAPRLPAPDVSELEGQPFIQKFDVGHRLDKNGKPIRDFVSVGERIHNEITYRGVDWLMNSAFGVGFAFITHRTAAGRKYFSEPVNNFFKRIFEPLIANKNTLESSVGWGVTFLSIMFGGTVTIPPLMALENPKNKVPFIKKIDTWIYGKDKVENDPKFKQAYDEVAHQPTKDFSTGMTTRFVALVPLLAATVYKPSNDFLFKHFYDHIASGTKFLAEKVGVQKGKYWAEMSEHGNSGVAISNSDYLHKTISFDFGLTIFYSVLHEVAYKFLARVHQNKHEKHQNDAEYLPSTEQSVSLKTEKSHERVGHGKHLPLASEAPATPQRDIPSTQVSHIAHEQAVAASAQPHLA